MKHRPKPTMPWKALFFGAGILLLALVPAWSSASSEKNAQSYQLKLNKTLKSLNDENKKLQIQQGMEKGLLDELELLDKQLTDLITQREDQSRQMQEAKEKLPELAQQIQIQQHELEKIRANRSSHLRLMYGMGSQGILKVVFSQENISKAQQGILYYGRLIQARNDQFRLYAEDIEKLRLATENHKALLAKTQSLADILAKELVQLEQKKGERAQLLANVRDKKALHQQKVEELQRARGILGAFVDKLHSALETISPPTTEAPAASQPEQKNNKPLAATPPPEDNAATSQGFERILQKKGRLVPPIGGRQALNRPPGLFYQVEKETAVKAVYRGQVVYADWFRGYGLLVILNHGDHVYSLYGHNQKLLVVPGDWVEAQDAIAQSGDSGSLEGISGLYFEIRDKGQSVNPRHWLGS